jgi:hypothetical protein
MVNVLLGCLFALVANFSVAGVPTGLWFRGIISWSVSLCNLMINLFDHFSLFVQVYVHNLVTEDRLISQLAKLTDTSFSKTIWI